MTANQTRLAATIAAIAILCAVGIGTLAVVGGNEQTIATPQADPQRPEPTSTTMSPTTAAPTTTTPPTTRAPRTTRPPAPPTTARLNPEDLTRRAQLCEGVLYLGGAVPSQQVSDQIEQQVTAILGPGNVVNEYTIVPDFTLVDQAPLTVCDTVLFEFGSARLTNDFIPLLDLGAALMNANPTVTIDVIAHTDSISSASFNQRLSERRANAIKTYWTDQGIDPERITPIGKGETEPLDTNNTDLGRTNNRRAEFIVYDFLTTP